ncbi:MAG TPA: (d)CMP kinase [Thermodesulfobacteriota bacterium]|nr:(d)CMP kinase [Thermodesulfobacteriota bacterium]
MKKGIIVTIDGPSGSGKGTVARVVAKRLGLSYLDTGAMYRAVALSAHRRGISFDNDEKLSELLSQVEIRFRDEGYSNQRVFLNGEDVTDEIRTSLISRLSSDIATKGVVRLHLKRMQREIGGERNIVAEGRDMGTYVFPDADFKFYIDAALDERARRRWLQLKERGIEANLEEVRRDIEIRDRQDRERAESPLHPASDAVIIDTTNLKVDEVVEKIIKIIVLPRG